MNRSTTLIRGLGALAWLLIVLIAVPVALAVLGGNPLPETLPSLGEVTSALTEPDDGSLLIATAVVIAWAAWASFALPLLLQLVCSLGRVRAPRIPGLNFQQHRASVTVAALTAMLSLGGATAATAGTTSDTAVASTTTATAATAPATTTPAAATPQKSSTATNATADEQAGEQAGASEHTVASGETLWEIADEELGQGDDYDQLVKASTNTVQPDGQRLSDPDMIRPGWTITVPADSSTGSQEATPSTGSSSSPDDKAGQGESPSQTAQPDTNTEAGSGSSAGGSDKSSSSAASDEAEQGSSPSASSTPVPSAGQADGASEGAPLPSASSPQASSPTTASREAGSATAKPSPPTTTSATSQDSAQAADEGNDWGGYLVLGGMGALLLAGAFTLIDRKRHRQSRRREVGHRIALPTGRAAITEAQMRTHADKATADELDQVARTLASYYADNDQPMPALRAARLTPGHVELYLVDADVVLPEPFIAAEGDPGVWLFDREMAQEHLLTPADAEMIPAPWPALVTLGQDEAGGALLINLEELGSLALHGPQPLDKEVLAALIVELLTGAWTDDSRVTLCGVMPELVEALGSDRVSYNDDLDRVLTGLEYGARVHRGILTDDASEATSSEQARITDAGEGDWTPQVLILGGDITDVQAQRLEQLVATRPRVAVASVTTDEKQVGEWSLTVAYTEHSTTASLDGDEVTLTLTPQRIPTAQLEDLLTIARTADEPDVGGPTWTEGIAPSTPIDLDDVPTPDEASNLDLEDLVDAETVPDVPTPTAEPIDHDDSVDDDEDALEAVTDPAATAHPSDGSTPAQEDVPAYTDTNGHQLGTQPSETDTVDTGQAATPDSPPATDTTPQVRVLPGPDQPLIRLLGPIDVIGAAGPRPSAPLRCTEVVAYLALHPGGSSSDFTSAIFPGQRPNSVGPKRNQYMRNSRAWLGQNAAGQPWVGMVPDIGYALDPSTEVDWWRFQRLIGDTIGTSSTDNLTAALRLVDGQPMRYPDEHRYHWADTDKNEIIAAVVDVAHELATRAITSGDPRTATWAALKGLGADPTNEALWRVRITAAHQTGDPDQAAAAITACRDTLDDLGDLDTTTHNLINTVLTNA